ncbi:MAG: MotA/TolQ/ExbB proton channel family protein [Desulfovibrionaceae bacterium]|jgi:biopolymer transport protein TolQ|nr:MotA/TolQ/ExbB proton channel family protein [Desulfovibrionaceae bacterium]
MPESGILSLLGQATLVVKIVLGLLACMSLGSWTIIFVKSFVLSAARRRAEADTRTFQDAASLRKAIKAIGALPKSPCYPVAVQGVNELNRLEEIDPKDPRAKEAGTIIMNNMRRALRRGVGTQMAELTGSLSFLATCANSAPFIGLFGTVWGIMHSFHSIGQMKTATLAAVAPGISEALVATAIGLAVAIPATIAYNTFLGMATRIETEMINFAGLFLNRVELELPGIVGRRTDIGNGDI